MGALQLTSVLVLHASPFQMGLLAALRVAPGMVFGLAAGVWADRLRRRPILIAADVCRAGLMGSIPIVYVLGNLRIEHLYVVAFVGGAMTIFFDTAYRSYLPSLVPRKQLIEANSKLSASDAVVEVTAFSAGGWIAQLTSAIVTAAVDAVSFVVSAAAIALIGRREPAMGATSEGRGMRGDAAEGLWLVWRDPILRPIAGSTAAVGFAFGGVGAIILLFGVRELGLSPGVLGTIFAVAGISSIIGAVYTERLTRRFGLGPTMVAGLAIFCLSMFLIPAAGGPLIVAGAVLVVQQFADGAVLVYEVKSDEPSPGHRAGADARARERQHQDDGAGRDARRFAGGWDPRRDRWPSTDAHCPHLRGDFGCVVAMGARTPAQGHPISRARFVSARNGLVRRMSRRRSEATLHNQGTLRRDVDP